MFSLRNFIIIGLVLVTINRVSNSYEIILERIETLLGENDRLLRFEDFRVKKFNRSTYVLNGKLNLLHSVGASSSGEAILYNFQGGQYKQMFTKSVENSCDFINSELVKSFYKDMLNHVTNPWEYGICPLPTGPNEVINFALEDTFLPPYVPGGEKWLLEIKVSENNDLIGGYKVYCLLRNEKSLLEG